MLFRSVRTGEGASAGMVVTNRAGEAIYAMESGLDGQALQASDIPGMTWGPGETVGTVEDSCGTRNAFTLVFESDDGNSLTEAPGEDAGLEVDGEWTTVCSIDSFEYADAGCAEETSFLMYK